MRVLHRVSILRILGLGAIVGLPLCSGARVVEARAPQPIAIVYLLTGNASFAVPGAVRRPLRLYDRFPAGTLVEVGPSARLALAFENGLRFELGEHSRATLGSTKLASSSGSVRTLPRTPPLPYLSPIAAEDHPGPRAGAVRIRAESISGLAPDRGATRLASATRLRFDPVSAAPQYRVQIIDPEGEVLFGIDTQTTEVSVPAGVLAPGKTYRWTVETLDRPGAIARGEAILVTLDARRARAREELQRWIQQSGTADDRGLLEGVDRALGLWEPSHHATRDASCPFSTPGVVVETVAPESAAFRVGLMPGDRLYSWCRAVDGGSCVAQGDLRTPFDWLEIHMEEVRRGGVVIAGTRGSESLRWKLLPTSQGLTVAPLLQGVAAEAYQASRDREQAGDPAPAAKELERAADLAGGDPCADAAIWLRARAAQLHAKARQWPEADAEYQAVVAKAQELGTARVEAHLQMSWSEALSLRGDAAQARQKLERALSLKEKEHPEGLGVVTVLSRLGNVAANLQDNVEDADTLYRRAYDLALRVAPGGDVEAATATNLSVSSWMRGDLAQAERYAARALAIREKLTPSGEVIIPNLVNYGNSLYARGDLAGAEAAFLRAKKILENVKPESMELAGTLHNLGEIAFRRGDDDAAESFFRRGLALYEKLDPSGRLVRDNLMGLAEVAQQRDRGKEAEESWQRALAISKKLNPRGPKSAWCLRGLAEAVKLQGRGAEAEKLLQQALAIWQEINPEAVDTGSIHLDLGVLFLEHGDTEAAEAHLHTAIRIQEGNRVRLPEGYHALARLQARRGQIKEAAASYLAAIDALESRRTRLGGAQESQWHFGSSLGNLYLEAVETQLALARPQEAWKLLERGRARGFQELLAQRDLRFPRELPAELYAKRRRLANEYDQAQAALVDWVPEQGAEKREALEGRLRDLRLEQAGVQEQIRHASPRLAALESPAPLDLTAARSALDRGTVLLEYAVGPERTWLFVVQSADLHGPGLSVFKIASGDKALREEVEVFRRLVDHPGSDRAALQTRARRLYRLLVHPAEARIAGARRILVSPDGPLHTLPFAALKRGDHYLIEWKPLHSVLSATVYAELVRSRPVRRASGEERLAAFGDPVYPPSAEKVSTDSEMGEAALRGLALQPLPSTRTEVESIAAVYSESRVYLGQEATEEKAKSLESETRLVHFACHGLLDERFPLNSALALTLPEKPTEGQDNGLLQAWEIFEDVRLDADLVTLSACDTALGKEMGGEGLVGLTRAFQYAGARSVLASLWGVSDDSTARFMKRFYGYLRDGKPKDEALRAAQIEQIRAKTGSSHPFYWAAFELFGDWR
jgi:CHAT domain-containing protein/Tfp pilus assembly protein PilF